MYIMHISPAGSNLAGGGSGHAGSYINPNMRRRPRLKHSRRALIAAFLFPAPSRTFAAFAFRRPNARLPTTPGATRRSSNSRIHHPLRRRARVRQPPFSTPGERRKTLPKLVHGRTAALTHAGSDKRTLPLPARLLFFFSFAPLLSVPRFRSVLSDVAVTRLTARQVRIYDRDSSKRQAFRKGKEGRCCANRNRRAGTLSFLFLFALLFSFPIFTSAVSRHPPPCSVNSWTLL